MTEELNRKEVARLNRKRGSRNEKKITKLLNGERKGIFGGEDISANVGGVELSIEAKSRMAFIGKKWIVQCIKNCPEGKMPIVIVHLHNTQHKDDLALLKMEDFIKLLEK